MKKHNILIYFTDQQRWDTAGCYGQKLATTPELDRMAASGTQFMHAFTPQPLCTPARACLQTGRYATELGIFMLDIAMPTDEKTIAHHLGDAGYETAYIGKWHLASTAPQYADPSKRPGQREPFECFIDPIPKERRGGYEDFWLASNHLESTSRGYGGYLFDKNNQRVDLPTDRFRVDALTDHAIDFLKNRKDASRPFLLCLSQLEPHWQNDLRTHDAPRGLDREFQNCEIPKDLDDFQGQPEWLIDEWRKEYPRYLACVKNLDDNLARIRETLRDLNLEGDTILVFVSDHGCHFGKYNNGAKDTCHESSIHIPLVIEGPGFNGHLPVEELVSLIDLAPTFMNAAGLPVSETMRGRPLQELFESESRDNWPDAVYYQLSPAILGRGIRTRRWKYAVKAPDRDGWSQACSDVYVEDYLFDLDVDPHESHNLVSDPDTAEVRAKLRSRLLGFMKRSGEGHPSILEAGRTAEWNLNPELKQSHERTRP